MMEQKPVPPPPWGSSTLPPTRVQWSPSLHTLLALQIQMGVCMHLFIGPGKSDYQTVEENHPYLKLCSPYAHHVSDTYIVICGVLKDIDMTKD